MWDTARHTIGGLPLRAGSSGQSVGSSLGSSSGIRGSGVRVSRVEVQWVYSIIWETSLRHLWPALVAAYYVGAEFILAGGHKF